MRDLITYTKISSPQGDHEASISLKWYAVIGSYKIEVCGVGTSKDEAAKSAILMLGQAKAALTVATTVRASLLHDDEVHHIATAVASLQGDVA
jgi:hypothetical protein